MHTFQPSETQRPYKMNSTIQLAATLCSFGTNDKVRLAIPALLAGDYKSAAEYLATAFMDTKEELDREQVATDITVADLQATIKARDSEIEDLREQVQDGEQDQQEAEARADRLEEELEDLRRRFKDLDAERQRALEDYFSMEAHYTMNCDVLREAIEARSIAEERLAELKEAQKGDAEYVAWLRAEIEELKAERPSTPIYGYSWGGGVKVLEEEMETAPVSPMAVADWQAYLCMARELLQPAYPKLELNANGCLKGCELCPAEAEPAVCYAGGQPYSAEKPLASATS